jgi:hypothetical protein
MDYFFKSLIFDCNCSKTVNNVFVCCLFARGPQGPRG